MYSTISYISWDLKILVIRLITFRDDFIPARALRKLLASVNFFRCCARVQALGTELGGRSLHMLLVFHNWYRFKSIRTRKSGSHWFQT